MKPFSSKIKNVWRAALSLLVAFALSTSAALAQTARIAYIAPVTVKLPGGSKTYNQIFTMNPDGSGAIQLTSSATNSLNPVWSPSQQYIAFNRGNVLWVMEAKGEITGGRSFPVASAGNWRQDWSPNGSEICFVGPGSASGLYRVAVSADTGAVGTPVLVRGGPEVFWPSWSPDGTRIAFCSSDDPVTQYIKVLQLATGTEITFGVGPTGSYNFTPEWKPDGSQIAFSGPVTTTTTARNGRQTSSTRLQIFIANADGSNITQVTRNTTDTMRPAWSPDGASLAYHCGGIYTTVIGSGVSTFLNSGNQPDWAP